MKFKPNYIMLIAALLPLALFFSPLWNIALEAPQYPDGIGMDIWINKIVDQEPNDIKNINLMNHYVGMKEIPKHMPEFDVFPPVIAIMSILGVIVAFIGKRKLYLVWFILFALLGAAGMYDFYMWEYDYGHSLNEHAAIKFLDSKGDPLAYQPPLIGSKTILNFVATSKPMLGAYALFLGIALSVVAFFKGKTSSN